ITCNSSSLAAGATATFSIVVKVNSSATGSVVNTASVSTATTDSNAANNSATASAPVTASADLVVTKTGPASVTPGQNATFTVTVTNNGPSDAQTVSLTDPVPANSTFVSESQTGGPAFACTTPPAGATGTIVCNSPSLAAGATATFSIVVKVNNSATGSVVNTASVSTATTDSNAANNSATASAPITLSADLAVTKTGPASVTAGQNATFTVVVANNGPSDAQTVSLTDAVPANSTFVSESQTSGPAFTCTTPPVGATGTVTCNSSSLAAGTTATFSIVVKVNSSATGSVVNTASVSATTSDPNAANNSATASSPNTLSADLAVTKSGPASVTAGQNATFTVVVTNNGPSDAQTVSLTDAVPANTMFVSESQTGGPAFACTTPPVGATGTITCNSPSLAAGTNATFLIVVKVNSSTTGSVVNTASVSTTTSDSNAANNSATASSPNTPSADLAVTKSGPASLTAGQNATFTVVVTNNGPSDAQTVSLTDTVPANSTFVSETQNAGPTFACTTPAAGGTGTVTCTIGTFSAGTSATFTLVVQTANGFGGTLSNTASITSVTADSNVANNNATTSTTVVLPVADLSLSKTASAPNILPNTNVTYTIVVTNGGPETASTVTVTDTLPPTMTFVSATTTQGTCTGTTTVTCSVGSILNGGSVTITITAKAGSTLGSTTNTATVTSLSSDPNPANNSSTASVNIVQNIPLLSFASLILLGIVLAITGIFVMRSG
ncbi:MAG TPA: DUF11 domain-containing protein, partial [Thermoanaerobaculia bacterium]